MWIFLACFTLFSFSRALLELFRGNRSLKQLEQIEPLKEKACPMLSVIVAARNEAENIEEALRSLLNHDYSNLELIVVNDRSTDDTPHILQKLAREFPKLKIVSIEHLPEKWLGKNYALYQGTLRASGEFYLFTDADILFKPTTLRRAMTYVQANQLEHLCCFPQLKASGIALNILIAQFTFYFILWTKPWNARHQKKINFIGIGAFNLVKASVYQKAGTHQAIAMRPDDDIKLGKLLKSQGYRQDFLIGTTMLSVEWYSSVRDLIQGLMKNSFASVNYQISLVLWGTFVLLFLNCWPFVAVFWTEGLLQQLNILILILLGIMFWEHSRAFKLQAGYGLFYPISTLLYLYILWKSTLLTLWHQGIFWRETFYPLKDLKEKKSMFL